MRVSFFDKFFSNSFQTAKFIDSRLQIFARYVIESLSLNNPNGVFTPTIDALKTAYEVYFGNYETKNISLAERKGSTSSLDDITRKFADAVRAKFNAIAAAFPEGTKEFLEFFPNGLTEFSKLTRGNILTISNRIAVKTNQYKDSITGGAAVAAMFATFETQISDAITAQNKKKSKVNQVASDVVVIREPVENALMKALFKVGDTFYPDKEKCNSYFDFSLLYGANRSKSIVKKGAAAAKSATLCIDKRITDRSIFTIKNLSDFPLEFYGTHNKDGDQVGVSVIVPPHTEHFTPFSEFGADDILFLYVKNDTEFDGNWEVRMD